MRDQDCILIFIPPLPEGRGGYTVFHPSKIYFVALFSVTVDGRDLIFGHKLHIGTPISWEAFLDPSDSYFLFANFVDFYTH
jgi:hypothetical protein